MSDRLLTLSGLRGTKIDLTLLRRRVAAREEQASHRSHRGAILVAHRSRMTPVTIR